MSNDLTKIEFTTSEGVDVIPTFDSMGLREDLLRGIYAYGMWIVGFKEYAKDLILFVLMVFMQPQDDLKNANLSFTVECRCLMY